MTEMDVIHKYNGIETKCRPDKRKGRSIFPKWFCFQCNRYVLPDGYKHFSKLTPDSAKGRK
jgi:hypothetical protein